MSEHSARLRVLVAEDEPHIRQYVTDILAERGDLEVVCTPSGEAALAAMSSERWDVVITDQRMGRMTGIEVLQAAARLQPHAQRAMMTGYTEVALLAAAKNDGRVHRFLSKPFAPEDLLREIGALLDASRVAAHRQAAFERAGALTVARDG